MPGRDNLEAMRELVESKVGEQSARTKFLIFVNELDDALVKAADGKRTIISDASRERNRLVFWVAEYLGIDESAVRRMRR